MGSRSKRSRSRSSSASESNSENSTKQSKTSAPHKRPRSREDSRRGRERSRHQRQEESRDRRGHVSDRHRHEEQHRGRSNREHEGGGGGDRHRHGRDREGDYRQDRNRRDRDRNHRRRRSPSFDHANARWGRDTSADRDRKSTNRNDGDDKSGKGAPKEKPNFGLSGKLTEETNTYRGVVIKYSEPPEARKPKRRWRLYPFKGDKALQTLYVHRESAYLIGRDRKVVDLPVDHPSCSKQHAALQYRLVPFTRDDGSTGKRIRPYLIDLNSANGTFINNKKIEASKYVELLEKDVIKFGFSSREYVFLHENSKDEAQDDDVKQEETASHPEIETKSEIKQEDE